MRRGDTKSKLFGNKLEAVKGYIKELESYEAHYYRRKSIRQYLF